MTTAAVLAFGGAATAFAQDDPASSTPVPTETVTSPPASTDPAPPSSTEPEPPHENPTQSPGDPTTPNTPAVAPPATTVEPPATTGTPEAPKPDEQKPERKVEKAAASADLKVTAKFDRSEYANGEPVSITVTVRNEGNAPANQIRFASDPWSMWLNSGVEELISRPSLAPGEVKTIKLGGVAQLNAPHISFTVRAYIEGATDPTPNDNFSRDEATFVLNNGMVNGVLFQDNNGNGVADPGEGLEGKELRLTGGPGLPNPTFRTGQDGQFLLFAVPAGTYQALFESRYGVDMSLKPGQFIVVKKNETTQAPLQAVPALSRLLKVSQYSFDKEKYRKGDPLSFSFTLSNTGTTPIDHVVTVCDPENDPATLDGTGDGWAAVSPNGQGVSIPAGGSVPVTITDVVPDGAEAAGKVYFACAFSIDGRNTNPPVSYPGAADPGLTTGAEVVGAFGGVDGWLNRPGNDSVKLVAVNPANGHVLGTTRTGGSFTFTNLPQGPIALKVVGKWKFADGTTQQLVNIVGGQNISVRLDVVSGPEVADPSVNAPDLKLSLSFDKASYDIGDHVQMTVKVENVGTGAGPAEGWFVKTWVQGQPNFDHVRLNKFLDQRFALWPGESRQLTISGTIDGQADKIRFKLRVDNGACCDQNPGNNEVQAEANVTWATGSATVTVYGDRNLNQRMDAGEELAGEELHVGGGKPWRNADAKSDASGKVRFTDLPAGRYFASSNRYSDWISLDPDQELVVNPGDEGTAMVRLVRPLSDDLKASIKFDQPSFQRGDQVGFTVSLTNSGTRPLQVKAWCYGGSSPYIGNNSAAWGLLADGAAGVALAVGATETVHVTAPMPEGAPERGYVVTNCDFGPEQAVGIPRVWETVKVVGETQTFSGLVVTGNYPDQKPVPNVKFVLLDPHTNAPVARTTTNDKGEWVFPDLPVGLYTPLVVGPWKVLNDWRESEPFGNVKGRSDSTWIWVEPGAEVADPDLVVAPDGEPGGGAGAGAGVAPVRSVKNTEALADTGVSVLGLSLFGVLLVLAGAALRRKPVA